MSLRHARWLEYGSTRPFVEKMSATTLAFDELARQAAEAQASMQELLERWGETAVDRARRIAQTTAHDVPASCRIVAEISRLRAIPEDDLSWPDMNRLAWLEAAYG